MKDRARQVELERTSGGTFIVTWVPVELAVVGKTLVHRSGFEYVVRSAYKLELDLTDLAREWRVGGL